MDLNLKNKVIIYTGAAGLIGDYVCRELASKEAKLVLLDTNASQLEKLKLDLLKISSEKNILTFSDVNLLDSLSIERMMDTVENLFGKVDCLINCAYPRSHDWHLKFEDIPFQSWQKNVDDHLNGYFLISQRVALRMIKQDYGNIIFFSSIYGLNGPDFSVYSGNDNMTMPAAYSAIKGAISNLTKYMASYLGRNNIRVNAICPGGVVNNQNEEFIRAYESKTPLGKMASVQDICGPLLFLISDLSKYITGVNLLVDGGWSCI